MVSSRHLDELCGQVDVVAGIFEFLSSERPSVVFEPAVLFKPVTFFASVSDIWDTKVSMED